MDRVRQPPVGSEQAALEPFKRSPASGNQANQRDPRGTAVLFPSKTNHVTPIPQVGQIQAQGYAVAEHDFATVWDADVLIWVMSQIFAARDPGFPTSHIFRFIACQLLIAVARATDNAEYQLLNGALTPPEQQASAPHSGMASTGAPGRSPGPTNGDS
jgi:hypothetical protein